MTDLDALSAMLERAGIQFQSKFLKEGVTTAKRIAIAPGGRMLKTGDGWDQYAQPHPGGYGGFFTEFVFDAEGALLAIWAWE